MTIYTITTIGKSHPDLKIPDRYRCVGWFENWEDADWVVENNTHLYEDGYYPYIVLTGVDPGLYPRPITRGLYKWNKEQQKYVFISKKNNRPKWFSEINFGIG